MTSIAPKPAVPKPITPEALIRWRDQHGWSQPQAAAKLGVPLGTLRQWEHGRRECPALLKAACWAVNRGFDAGEIAATKQASQQHSEAHSKADEDGGDSIKP